MRYGPNAIDLAWAVDAARREELARALADGRRRNARLRAALGTGLVRLGERLLPNKASPTAQARPSAR